jgi:uncharacterized membrane protein
MHLWVTWASQGMEALAVFVLVASIVYGGFRFLLQLARRATDPFIAFRTLLGRSLLLSLELLVAEDVIRTVLLDLTLRSVSLLGALIVVRTLLSWSISVELEGHWPWRSAALAAEAVRATPVSSDADIA